MHYGPLFRNSAVPWPQEKLSLLNYKAKYFSSHPETFSWKGVDWTLDQAHVDTRETINPQSCGQGQLNGNERFEVATLSQEQAALK